MRRKIRDLTTKRAQRNRIAWHEKPKTDVSNFRSISTGKGARPAAEASANTLDCAALADRGALPEVNLTAAAAGPKSGLPGVTC